MTPWYCKGEVGEFLLTIVEDYPSDRQVAMESCARVGMNTVEIREFFKSVEMYYHE
jgi:hypothetical protein